MKTIRLIHWKPAEAESEIKNLQKLGYKVNYDEFRGLNTLRQLREEIPAAVIIDLNRLPSQGRDVALALRVDKTTRFIPILFADGAGEKIARVKETIPDATFTEWHQIGAALEDAIRNPPENPVVPKSGMAGYSNTPLPKKLGFKKDMTATLINAPANFAATLGTLPENTHLETQLKPLCELIIWFTQSQAELENRIHKISEYIGPKSSLWIAWPKKGSGKLSDLTQNVVRQTGLANGLVDYKICSIDKTWSALRFAIRKTQ